ncbi:hypothetical protein [Peptoniphilus mikwangii]|uniref:hypothetical protein n=1 Tax=Peptoniphilus mikwangii TaxID=1354300 RepID=UPI0004115F59|nr:hypothetical protein [Peptoniphilus mikwangii]
MKNENVKMGATILISAILPMYCQFTMGDSAFIKGSGMFVGFWVIMNYLFLSTVIELFSNYSKMFKLKKLVISKTTFIMNLFVYIAFLIYINCYFIQQLYIRDNSALNTVARPIVVIIILMTFIINLLCGIFPKKEGSENINVYSISNTNSFKYGREMFGTVIGSFEDGIIFGNLPIKYSDFKSIYYDKKPNALVLKGKNENGNFRISISAVKSMYNTISLIDEAVLAEKIDKNIINI